MKRNFYQDTYNYYKTWEVVTLSGGFYLRQYVKGLQYGRGTRVTKRFLKDTGILSMKCAEKPLKIAPAQIHSTL